MKKLNLYKIMKKPVNLTPLRLVKGKFGNQIIADIKGTEYFLPRHTQLITLILENGLKKPIQVELLQNGDKRHQTEYRIFNIQEKDLGSYQQKLL